MNLKKPNGSISYFLLFSCVLFSTSSCVRESDIEYYRPFADHTWYRFNILQFEIPVEKQEKLYDIHLYIRHSRDYKWNSMDLNMVMFTPSGEERIREFQMNIRNTDGSFKGRFVGDSCEVSVVLENEIRFMTKGILKIQIENLVPRMETNGLLGVGIRLKPIG